MFAAIGNKVVGLHRGIGDLALDDELAPGNTGADRRGSGSVLGARSPLSPVRHGGHRRLSARRWACWSFLLAGETGSVPHSQHQGRAQGGQQGSGPGGRGRIPECHHSKGSRMTGVVEDKMATMPTSPDAGPPGSGSFPASSPEIR